MSRAWMIVERIENWEVDNANSFSFFGLKARYRKTADQIKIGDSIICYVSSGLGLFSDIRVVEDANLKILRFQSYNRDFPYYFTTSPVLVLPREHWVPLKEIAADLELTKDRADYRPILQTSIRALTVNDFVYLQKRMERAAEAAAAVQATE